MTSACRLGLLLALVLAPVGCAHTSGTLAPSGPRGAAVAPVSPADSPAGEAPGAAAAGVAQAGPAAADLALEDELYQLDTPAAPVADPLAPWNRAMFQFNDKFYFWLLKPVSRAYRSVVPGFARTGFENFFSNLGAPTRFVSNLLQLKGREATIELGKFMINSTWGVLGFGNLFAGNAETIVPDADLGLAMAHHGVGGGPFVVWPILGPYTLRDTAGWVGGLFIDPVSYVQPFPASLGVRSFNLVNRTSSRIGDYESLKDASIDPYVAARDAYLQNRADQARK